ncbi:MAG: hypothetical protein CMH91_10215 [Oceanicaulis sp.]|nr:hypothetical protein [Oceanicaulis sp.]MBC39417.1 hypothetical protein [Oceanicaulis sp.]MBG35098.1 hypothetical protein [Oceanicaulis sp.]HBU63732.1 hypothetical protein [Oceanicaulis sp.]
MISALTAPIMIAAAMVSALTASIMVPALVTSAVASILIPTTLALSLAAFAPAVSAGLVALAPPSIPGVLPVFAAVQTVLPSRLAARFTALLAFLLNGFDHGLRRIGCRRKHEARRHDRGRQKA